MANQRQLEPNVVLSSLFIPYYFLVSFDKLSFSPLAFSRKKEPIGWLILSLEKNFVKKSCENDFISLQKVKNMSTRNLAKLLTITKNYFLMNCVTF